MTTTEATQEQARLAGSDVLTHSSEQAYMTCPRLYYWQYELGWRPARTGRPLRIGSAVHLGLDVLAKTGRIDEALEAVHAAYANLIADAAGWQDAETAVAELELEAVTAECLASGYAGAWANSPVEIVASETTFNLPIINPATRYPSRTFRQAGKRDRLCRLPDGRTAIMETKTVGESIAPDADYWRITALNHQISKYILAAQDEGLDVQTCLYDVIRKPTIRPTPVPVLDDDGLKIVVDAQARRVLNANSKPRQTASTADGYTILTAPMTADEWREKLAADIAERPEYYYARREIPRLDADLAEYAGELWQIAEAIRESRNAGRWFRNSGACKRWGSLCPYYALCAGEIDVTAGVPAGFRQAETAHEELEPDNGEGQ